MITNKLDVLREYTSSFEAICSQAEQQSLTNHSPYPILPGRVRIHGLLSLIMGLNRLPSACVLFHLYSPYFSSGLISAQNVLVLLKLGNTQLNLLSQLGSEQC